MSKIKRIRPSRLLLYFSIFASFVNCVFIGAVIFSHRHQNRKVAELLSKIPSAEVRPVPKVASFTNSLPSLPTLSRFQSSAVPESSSSPYAVVRPPRSGSDLAQVITHEGEMRYIKYSELPPAWRKSKSNKEFQINVPRRTFSQ